LGASAQSGQEMYASTCGEMLHRKGENGPENGKQKMEKCGIPGAERENEDDDDDAAAAAAAAAADANFFRNMYIICIILFIIIFIINFMAHDF
jgi:hypothetical protein